MQFDGCQVSNEGIRISAFQIKHTSKSIESPTETSNVRIKTVLFEKYHYVCQIKSLPVALSGVWKFCDSNATEQNPYSFSPTDQKL